MSRVLLAADLVPTGTLVSYGDIAALVGTSPRRVGSVMAEHGHEVCWWRVVNAAGELPAHLAAHARIHWQEEAMAVKASGRGCHIAAHHADLAMLADAYEAALSRGACPTPND